VYQIKRLIERWVFLFGIEVIFICYYCFNYE